MNLRFKVWNEVLKQWVESKTCFLSAEGAIHFKMNDWLSFAAPHYKAVFSTGQKDRKGKDIFEGDILKVDDGDDDFVVQVYWHEGNAMFTTKPDIDMGESYIPALGVVTADPFLCEVIGNIYENKELLK